MEESKSHIKGNPKKVLKVLSWLEQFQGNLSTVRTMYNGIQGIMSPHNLWTRESMARVAWDLHCLSEKLIGMAQRAERVSKEIGEIHGYMLSEGGEILDTLGEAERENINSEVEMIRNIDKRESEEQYHHSTIGL